MTGADGIPRTRAETGHQRGLVTVFGEVTVTRMAYRAPGAANLHPTDAELNLPEEKHSHGMRKLAPIESARGSFESAAQPITRATGAVAGQRQVEQLARRPAADVDAFMPPGVPAPGLTMSCTAKKPYLGYATALAQGWPIATARHTNPALTAKVAPDRHAAADLLRDQLKPGDIVLVKASRSLQLEDLAATLAACSPSPR